MRRRQRGMKESILDVLLYLFEHYFANDIALVPGNDPGTQDSTLLGELIDAGFSADEVHRAFDWLDVLASQRPAAQPIPLRGPIRVFHGAELAKLDVNARGFLLLLEQHSVLDANQRELVLDRAMVLDQDTLDLDDLKWVVLLVLFNQPGSEAAYAWMETQMYLDDPEPLH